MSDVVAEPADLVFALADVGGVAGPGTPAVQYSTQLRQKLSLFRYICNLIYLKR